MKQIRSFRAFGFALIASMSALMLSAQAGDQAVLQQRLYSQFRLTDNHCRPLQSCYARRCGRDPRTGVTHVRRLLAHASGKHIQEWENQPGLGWLRQRHPDRHGGARGRNRNRLSPSSVCARGKVLGQGNQAQRDGVLFQLYSDPYDGIRDYANLKIPFPNKKEIPPVDQVMQTVSQVLTVMRQDDQGNQGGQQAQQSPQGQFQGNPAPSAFVPGKDIRTGALTPTSFSSIQAGR